jgi:hypothetical protein
MRTGGCCQTVDREISRFPRKERLHMPGSLTTPGRPNARDDAPRRLAFHDLHGVGTQNRKLSRLNGWPMRSPVNASLRPSRATAHDSGPMWIATPSSQGTCTLYSLPVSRRLADIFRSSADNRHLGERLARLSLGGRECFHSISNMASPLPAPEQADKVSRSPCRLELDSFYSFVITRCRLRMNGRFAPEAVVR